MTFPHTPLDAGVELQVGSWVDLVAGGLLFKRDKIVISRGAQAEDSEVTRHSKLAASIANESGDWSPRNPSSPYFGILGRNTPVRAWVKRGTRFLDCPGDAETDAATAPDAAALGVTGDIDIRVDLTTAYWCGRSLDGVDLAAKWVAASEQRSWAFQLVFDGRLQFTWTTAGTFASAIAVRSTVSLPTYPGRRTLRVTLDVNNGAAGNTCTFYTGPAGMAGPWTQLGDPVVTAGTTSIFDSTAGLTVGAIPDLSFLPPSGALTDPLIGHVHAFELRNGISGTAVANPDFSAPAEGATSFADAAGNTWSVGGGASITSRHWRFHGEVSELPQSYHRTGLETRVAFKAAGILRRLTQGDDTLGSALRRGLLAETDVIAYWPCEEPDGATQFASALPSGLPMRITGTPTLATSTAFVCSSPLPTLSLSRWSGSVGAYTSTGRLQTRFLLLIPSAGTVDGAVIARLLTSGSCLRWDLVYNTATSGTITLKGYDEDDVNLFSTVMSTAMNGVAWRISIDLTQNGANVDYGVSTQQAGASNASGTAGTLNTRTVGILTRVNISSGTIDDVVVGHVSVQTGTSSILAPFEALKAYTGEVAGRRLNRICREQGITFRYIGDINDTAAMGPQRPTQFGDLVSECVNADGGVLFEPREVLGIGYRTRVSLYNQPARHTVAVDDLDEPIDPLDDLDGVQNYVTAKRSSGASAVAELTTGRLSTQAPPDGIGTYPASPEINIRADELLPDHAWWRLHLGTVDEARHPDLVIDGADTALTAAQVDELMEMDVGDRVVATGPPAQLPPDDITQIARGYQETLGQFEHGLDLACTPESPYQVGVYGTSRYGTAGSSLASSATSTATSLSVATAVGPLWTTNAAHMPISIRVGGEVMSVTAISGASSPQTFTVTRSVNGVVKAHSSGAAVELDQPAVRAL